MSKKNELTNTESETAVPAAPVTSEAPEVRFRVRADAGVVEVVLSSKTNTYSAEQKEYGCSRAEWVALQRYGVFELID